MKTVSLPKVELHLHLDCNLSYPLVSRLDPGISFEEYQDKFIAPAKCTDLMDYLTRVYPAYAYTQTADNLRLVVADLFEQLATDNVIYAEIRFAPLLHTEQGLTPEQVVAVVEQATAESSQGTGIEARIILCTLRHYSADESMQTVRLVEQYQGSKVAGFDIAADEAGYPVDAHITAFQYAGERGIPCTAHAGEACGPESVWETLEQFRPLRIGHGVRSIEDPSLVSQLRERQIHLEVCPTCNVQTDIFATYANHAIDRLYRNGLSVGINTDCRTTSNITLSQEYAKLHETFGWAVQDFYCCNQNSLQAAFIDDDVRAEIARKLSDGYATNSEGFLPAS
jgi:adenosine deaminase